MQARRLCRLWLPADLFPTSRFRQAYEALRGADTQRGTHLYLELLQLAAWEGESAVDDALRHVLPLGRDGEFRGRAAYLHQPVAPVTTAHVGEIVLTYCDELLPDYGRMQ